jgi:hypothetical protein
LSQKEKEIQKIKNTNRHEFLIEQYFNGVHEGYATKIVGDWVLVRQWNGGTNRWEVAIYTRESFNIAREFSQKNLL